MSAVDRVKAIVATLGTYGDPSEIPYEQDGIELIDTENMGEWRLGFDEQTTFRVDGELVGVYRYVVTGDGDSPGPDQWEVYPVKEKQTVKYVRVKG